MNLKQMKLGEIKKIKSFFHEKDDLMRGITFEALLTAVGSNEKEINENVVKTVFKELLDANLEDAHSELKENMKQIIKELKGTFVSSPTVRNRTIINT
jgi:hypothetical protein